MSDHPIRVKIINATIECIEKEGIQNLTTRNIANRAEVNIAAVNYYFGSKDRLVEIALETSLENAFSDWQDILDDPSLAIEVKVERIYRELLQGALKWPGLARAHLYEPIYRQNYDTRAVSRMNGFFSKLDEQIRQQAPGAETTTKLKIAFSTLLFSGLVPYFFSPDSQALDDADQQKLISVLVNMTLSD